jgi:homoserine dehydrogenase
VTLSSGTAPLRVALLGVGTVGREVARALLDRGDHLESRAGGRRLELVKVGVRDPGRNRGLSLPAGIPVTEDLESVAGDPAVDVVIELLGGYEPALTLVSSTLGSGRGVVTANKALLARHGATLEALSRESGAPLRFEAAVGGGIPILGPLAEDLAADRITAIRGIVNGTTNYILDQILELNERYEEVLREAQALGYAEADPRGDVEGDDAVHKLVLLTRLGFGGWLDPDAISRRLPTVRGESFPGITGIRYEDMDGAAALEHEIKLIARVQRSDTFGDDASAGGTEVRASVLPMLVPTGTALGSTDGADNRVEVEGTPIGRVGFDGPGAGGHATSSAVLGDLIAIARGRGSTWGGARPPVDLVLRPGLTGAGYAEPRPWFVFLRDVSADELGRAYVGDTVERPEGTAVITTPVDVRRLRRGLQRILPEGVDAVLYPLLEDEG